MKKLNVLDAIAERRSIRGFLDKEISKDLVSKILAYSSRAPSGSNTQPWKVYVVTGKARDKLCEEMVLYREQDPDYESPQYQYYPVNWREPYINRRRKTGWGLYGVLGINKGDRDKMFKQQLKNYQFFGAPVGLFFTLDNDMEMGSWLDCGMFIQNIMLVARAFGLETCPQAAWVYHHKMVRKLVPLPENETLVCGMALGYEDTGEVANEFVTDREQVTNFSTFFGFDS